MFLRKYKNKITDTQTLPAPTKSRHIKTGRSEVKV